MARKRARPGWPQLVFKYAVRRNKDNKSTAEIPDGVWALARRMNGLWAQLCDAHAAVRGQIDANTPEASRKLLWQEFDTAARQLVVDSGLNWQTGPDVFDRFNKACTAVVAARKHGLLDRGWPHPRPLSVSLMHRYTNTGKPVAGLSSPRKAKLKFDSPLDYSPDDPEAKKVVGLTFDTGYGVITADIVVHRPIPPEATVKSVRWVGKRSTAFGWEWSICVQVELPPYPPAPVRGKSAAIDVGWRKFPQYLRVGYMVDTDGHEQELQLPLSFGGNRTKRYNSRHADKPGFYRTPECHDDIRELRSARDMALERCKADITSILGRSLPGQVAMRRNGLLQLRAELRTWIGGDTQYSRHDGTIVGVRDSVLALSVPVCEQLDARITDWVDRDSQQLRTETRATQRATAARVDLYANWADAWTRKYDKIYVEAMSTADMLEAKPKKSKGGDDEEAVEAPKRTPAEEAVLEAVRRNHQIAATAELVAALKRVAKRNGCEIVDRQAAQSTARHHACGNSMTTGPALFLECPHCGVTVDQDRNAAINLLSGQWPDAAPHARRSKRRRLKPKDPEGDAAAMELTPVG